MPITPLSDESRSFYNAGSAVGPTQSCRTRVTGSTGGTLVVLFGFIALLGAQLLLVLTIPGTNYDGADGQAAQAEIITTLGFARPFDISNLNPLQGFGSQVMPMNVWVNPAFWPFAFFDLCFYRTYLLFRRVLSHGTLL